MYNFDFCDFWCVYRESMFNVNIVRNFMNCECFVDFIIMMFNYNIFKDLDMFMVIFNNFNVYM